MPRALAVSVAPGRRRPQGFRVYDSVIFLSSGDGWHARARRSRRLGAYRAKRRHVGDVLAGCTGRSRGASQDLHWRPVPICPLPVHAARRRTYETLRRRVCPRCRSVRANHQPTSSRGDDVARRSRRLGAYRAKRRRVGDVLAGCTGRGRGTGQDRSLARPVPASLSRCTSTHLRSPSETPVPRYSVAEFGRGRRRCRLGARAPVARTPPPWGGGGGYRFLNTPTDTLRVETAVFRTDQASRSYPVADLLLWTTVPFGLL